MYMYTQVTRSSVNENIYLNTGFYQVYIDLALMVYLYVYKRKEQRDEKKNCEGRALTLEQVPVLVERSQGLCLIRLLFEVEHPSPLFQLLFCLRPSP